MQCLTQRRKGTDEDKYDVHINEDVDWTAGVPAFGLRLFLDGGGFPPLSVPNEGGSADGFIVPAAVITRGGRTGLPSLGNTCYMNAVLQMIATLQVIATRLRANVRPGPVTRSVLAVFDAMVGGRDAYDELGTLFAAILFAGWKSNVGVQADPDEFLHFLVLHLDHETGRAMSDVLACVGMQHMTCRGCGWATDGPVDYTLLPINITQDDNLVSAAVRPKSEGEELEEFDCIKCGPGATAIKRDSVETTADVLIFSLKRFKNIDGWSKDCKSFRFVKIFNVAALSSKSAVPKQFYQLVAVVRHCGLTLADGHYDNFVRGAAEWLHINDSQVTPAGDFNDVHAACVGGGPNTAYLLMYERCEGGEPRGPLSAVVHSALNVPTDGGEPPPHDAAPSAAAGPHAGMTANNWGGGGGDDEDDSESDADSAGGGGAGGEDDGGDDEPDKDGGRDDGGENDGEKIDFGKVPVPNPGEKFRKIRGQMVKDYMLFEKRPHGAHVILNNLEVLRALGAPEDWLADAEEIASATTIKSRVVECQVISSDGACHLMLLEMHARLKAPNDPEYSIHYPTGCYANSLNCYLARGRASTHHMMEFYVGESQKTNLPVMTAGQRHVALVLTKTEAKRCKANVDAMVRDPDCNLMPGMTGSVTGKNGTVTFTISPGFRCGKKVREYGCRPDRIDGAPVDVNALIDELAAKDEVLPVTELLKKIAGVNSSRPRALSLNAPPGLSAAAAAAWPRSLGQIKDCEGHICDICGDGGDDDSALHLCDVEDCPRAFHDKCLPPEARPGAALTWHCPRCPKAVAAPGNTPQAGEHRGAAGEHSRAYVLVERVTDGVRAAVDATARDFCRDGPDMAPEQANKLCGILGRALGKCLHDARGGYTLKEAAALSSYAKGEQLRGLDKELAQELMGRARAYGALFPDAWLKSARSTALWFIRRVINKRRLDARGGDGGTVKRPVKRPASPFDICIETEDGQLVTATAAAQVDHGRTYLKVDNCSCGRSTCGTLASPVQFQRHVLNAKEANFGRVHVLNSTNHQKGPTLESHLQSQGLCCAKADNGAFVLSRLQTQASAPVALAAPPLPPPAAPAAPQAPATTADCRKNGGSRSDGGGSGEYGVTATEVAADARQVAIEKARAAQKAKAEADAKAQKSALVMHAIGAANAQAHGWSEGANGDGDTPATAAGTGRLPGQLASSAAAGGTGGPAIFWGVGQINASVAERPSVASESAANLSNSAHPRGAGIVPPSLLLTQQVQGQQQMQQRMRPPHPPSKRKADKRPENDGNGGKRQAAPAVAATVKAGPSAGEDEGEVLADIGGDDAMDDDPGPPPSGELEWEPTGVLGGEQATAEGARTMADVAAAAAAAPLQSPLMAVIERLIKQGVGPAGSPTPGPGAAEPTADTDKEEAAANEAITAVLLDPARIAREPAAAIVAVVDGIYAGLALQNINTDFMDFTPSQFRSKLRDQVVAGKRPLMAEGIAASGVWHSKLNVAWPQAVRDSLFEFGAILFEQRLLGDGQLSAPDIVQRRTHVAAALKQGAARMDKLKDVAVLLGVLVSAGCMTEEDKAAAIEAARDAIQKRREDKYK